MRHTDVGHGRNDERDEGRAGANERTGIEQTEMNRSNDRKRILDAITVAQRALNNARGLFVEAQSAADLRRVATELERALAHTSAAREHCEAAIAAVDD